MISGRDGLHAVAALVHKKWTDIRGIWGVVRLDVPVSEAS